METFFLLIFYLQYGEHSLVSAALMAQCAMTFDRQMNF